MIGMRNGKSNLTMPVVNLCICCETKHEKNKEKSPAWGKNCRECNGRNHFATNCQKSGQPVHGLDTMESDTSESNSDIEIITSICIEEEMVSQVSGQEYAKEIYAEMMIDDNTVKFPVDCRASVNILPMQHAHTSETCQTRRNCTYGQSKPKEQKEIFHRIHCGARAIYTTTWSTSGTTNGSNPGLIHHLTTADQIIEQYSDIFNRKLGTLPGVVRLQIALNR